MKIPKEKIRTMQRSVEDGLYQVDQLRENAFMSNAHVTRLDVVRVLLLKISTCLEGKHGRRRHD